MTHETPPNFNRQLNLPTWWITFTLMLVNISLFCWQVLFSGMDISQPSTHHALAWGADFTPLTFSGQAERLFTSMFFHFGLIHLMLNMYALYIFGRVTEPLMGKIYYISLYLLAGLAGSLLSSYLNILHGIEFLQTPHRDLLPRVSAGASGAVMGLGAALTILSLYPPLAKQVYILNKQALLIVMAINLVFGFTVSGINNAAHIGGMIMGAFLASTWYIGKRYQSVKLVWLSLFIAILVISVFFLYCTQLNIALLPLWQEILHVNQLR